MFFRIMALSSSEMMLYLLFLILFLESARAATNDLLTALSAQTSLTTFTSLMRNSTSLLAAAEVGNMTATDTHGTLVLAPTDDAFKSFFANSTAASNYSTTDQLEALLSYHVLKGAHAQYSIGSSPQFIPTLLTNMSYTNVTTGQVVEAISNNNVVTFDSAVNRVSKIGPVYDIIFLGGLVHIIDEVLVPPFSPLQTVTEAPLPYFIQVLSLVLNNQFSDVLQNITNAPNSTFFAANGPEILGLTETGISADVVNFTEYSILPKIVYSPELTNGSTFETTAGVNVTITVVGGNTYVNDALITRKDLLVANGVIHVVDKTLNSSNPNARPQINTTTATPVSSSGSSSSSGGLSAGAKAGIGVGVVLAVLIVGGGLIFLLMRKKRNNQTKSEPEPAQKPVTYPTEMGETQRLHEMESNKFVPELEARTWTQELHGRPQEHTVDGGAEDYHPT